MNNEKRTMKKGGMAIIAIAIFSIAFISCDDKPDTTTAIERDYTLTLLGKTVTVTDTRTGAADKSLEALGVMEKLRGAMLVLDDYADTRMSTENRAAYDKVLAKGMIIIVEKPDVAYNNYKTKADGKTMMFDIDHISRTEATSDIIAGHIDVAITIYLDQAIEKISKAPATNKGVTA